MTLQPLHVSKAAKLCSCWTHNLGLSQTNQGRPFWGGRGNDGATIKGQSVAAQNTWTCYAKYSGNLAMSVSATLTVTGRTVQLIVPPTATACSAATKAAAENDYHKD